MNEPGAARPQRRIPSLDGLRAISIGLVLISHLAGTTGFPIGFAWMTSHFGDLGNLGVRVFFVISGFLITTLLLDERATTGKISLGAFYVRRFFRIFPAAYVLIAVLFVLDSLGVIETLEHEFITALTYTTNFRPSQSQWLRHLWSLSVEEQFYLSWPAVLFLVGVRRAAWVAVAQIVAAPILRVIVWYRFPSHRHFQEFYLAMDPIAMGCLLAICRSGLARQRTYAAFLRSRWFYLVPVGLLLTSIAAEHRFMVYIVHDSIMNIGIAICVHRFVTFPADAGGRFLNLRPISYVGTLSYSLYLWQQVFMERGSGALVQTFPINLALAFTVALGSYYGVERPMLRLRSRISERRRRAAGGPRPAVAGE